MLPFFAFTLETPSTLTIDGSNGVSSSCPMPPSSQHVAKIINFLKSSQALHAQGAFSDRLHSGKFLSVVIEIIPSSPALSKPPWRAQRLHFLRQNTVYEQLCHLICPKSFPSWDRMLLMSNFCMAFQSHILSTHQSVNKKQTQTLQQWCPIDLLGNMDGMEYKQLIS